MADTVPIPQGATIGQAQEQAQAQAQPVPIPQGAEISPYPVGAFQAAKGAPIQQQQEKQPEAEPPEDSFWQGLKDNLYEAAHGLYTLAKNQGQYTADKLGALHEGNYKEGAKDAIKALVSPTSSLDSPVMQAFRRMIVEQYKNSSQANNSAGELLGKGVTRLAKNGLSRDTVDQTISDYAQSVKDAVKALPVIGPSVVKTGEDLNDRPRYALGEFIGNLAQFAGPEALSEGGLLERTGKGLESEGLRGARSVLRAKKETNFLYGKDPGRALIDENIKPTNSIENLAAQLEKAGDALHARVKSILNRPNVAAQRIDIVPTVDQAVSDALKELASTKGMRNRQAVVDAMMNLRRDIVFEYDPFTGTATGPVPRNLTPAEVADIKQGIGKNTKWDSLPGAADPVISEVVNKLRKTLYAKLNDLVEQAAKNGGAASGVKDLNLRYANVIEARRLLARRIATEEMNELGLNRLLSHFEKGGIVTAAATGHPMAAGALAAQHAWRSTLGRILRGQGFSAAGQAMQNAPEAVAGATIGAAATGREVEGALSDKRPREEFRMVSPQQ